MMSLIINLIQTAVMLVMHDNYTPFASQAMPFEGSSTGDSFLSWDDINVNRDTSRARIMKVKEYKKYRHELHKLQNRHFKVISRVEKYAIKKVINHYGREIKIATMLITNVSCFMDDEEVAYTDHTWLSGDVSKIVYDKDIVPGDHIEFIGIVNKYKYKFGMTQLGLIQIGESYRVYK